MAYGLFLNKKEIKCLIILAHLSKFGAVHRSALAWEKLTSEVGELNKLIQICSSIPSYFRKSGLRTNELKQVALDEQKTMYTLPKYFDVRWTEFTYNLLLNILRNWRILVKFFILKKHDKDNKTKAEGFLKNLTDVNKINCCVFLLTWVICTHVFRNKSSQMMFLYMI